MSDLQDSGGPVMSPPKRGWRVPKAPVIGLDQVGRLRVAHLLAILACSHSTLYAGLRTGRYPKPDGYDGKFPYWMTTTMKAFLEGLAACNLCTYTAFGHSLPTGPLEILVIDPAAALTAMRPSDFCALLRLHRVWFTPMQAAAYLGVKPRTLEAWRAAGGEPKFRGRGKGIRYHIDDLAVPENSAPERF